MLESTTLSRPWLDGEVVTRRSGLVSCPLPAAAPRRDGMGRPAAETGTADPRGPGWIGFLDGAAWCCMRGCPSGRRSLLLVSQTVYILCRKKIRIKIEMEPRQEDCPDLSVSVIIIFLLQ